MGWRRTTSAFSGHTDDSGLAIAHFLRASHQKPVSLDFFLLLLRLAWHPSEDFERVIKATKMRREFHQTVIPGKHTVKNAYFRQHFVQNATPRTYFAKNTLHMVHFDQIASCGDLIAQNAILQISPTSSWKSVEDQSVSSDAQIISTAMPKLVARSLSAVS